MSIGVGVAGLGVVAQGLLNIFKQQGAEVNRIVDDQISVTRIASRRLRDEVDLAGIEFTTDLDSLFQSPEVDVVVELIGGTDASYNLIKNALESGKGVVTANKAVLAERGNELLEIAKSSNVPLAFEAAVAGGIPIIAPLKTRFPGNRISTVTGIINGTCNYILTQMSQEGAEFGDALKQAQELGYAEADPSFDIGGTDAAQKLAILAALAFDVPINVEAVHCEGIEEINGDDIRHAFELGYAIKHLAVGQQINDSLDMRVHPALVSMNNLLAKVDDVENAVQVSGESTGTLRFMGAGAGGSATASAVMSDIANIASGLYRHVSTGNQSLSALPIESTESAFYLSISAVDHPGVIARIGETLARRGISIDSMIQKKEEVVHEGEDSIIPVIILTNQVVESSMNDALQELNQSDDIASLIKTIRVVNS